MKSHRLWQTYKQDLYTINNLIRLIIVGCSISFFMIITLMEAAQSMATVFYRAQYNLKNLKPKGGEKSNSDSKALSEH